MVILSTYVRFKEPTIPRSLDTATRYPCLKLFHARPVCGTIFVISTKILSSVTIHGSTNDETFATTHTNSTRTSIYERTTFEDEGSVARKVHVSFFDRVAEIPTGMELSRRPNDRDRFDRINSTRLILKLLRASRLRVLLPEFVEHQKFPRVHPTPLATLSRPQRRPDERFRNENE